MRDYLELTKPRVVLLIVFTALVGMCLAAPVCRRYGRWRSAPWVSGLQPHRPQPSTTSSINGSQQSEVARTRHRPLPEGKPGRCARGYFFAGAGALSMALLICSSVNPLNGVADVCILIGYAIAYALWLKRATPQNIAIGGAVAGAASARNLGWQW
jgi:protoheme IX farnesyltransferase